MYLQLNFYVKITKSSLDIRQNLESLYLKARHAEHLYQLIHQIRAIAGYFSDKFYFLLCNVLFEWDNSQFQSKWFIAISLIFKNIISYFAEKIKKKIIFFIISCNCLQHHHTRWFVVIFLFCFNIIYYIIISYFVKVKFIPINILKRKRFFWAGLLKISFF